jgi:exodeoxyribonuclease-5
MELTPGQEIAKEKIVEWYRLCRITGKQLFYLSGYAGTGKTFLISHIIDILELEESQVAFATYTGKAASVLIQKGQSASTIHRLIYKPVEEEYETKVGEEKVISKRIEFVKKTEGIPNYKLIIIDEVSMVDDKMMKDLLSFGIPVLATGDLGQLPPISGTSTYLENPDATLTDIVRQAEDNPIIKLATLARSKQEIPYGNYGSVLVLNRKNLSPLQMKDLLLKADQVICGTNATRNYLNTEIRRLKGIDIIKDKFPIPGDKIICTVNNWEKTLDEDETYNLVNGIIGTVATNELINRTLNLSKLSFKSDFLDVISEEFVYDNGIFLNDEWTYDMHQRVFTMANGSYKLKQWLARKTEKESFEQFRDRIRDYVLTQKNSVEDEQINRFEFGYAISCHKSQGSEFDKVVLFDESYLFGEPEKWLYTGITRAKKKLVIIR